MIDAVSQFISDLQALALEAAEEPPPTNHPRWAVPGPTGSWAAGEIRRIFPLGPPARIPADVLVLGTEPRPHVVAVHDTPAVATHLDALVELFTGREDLERWVVCTTLGFTLDSDLVLPSLPLGTLDPEQLRGVRAFLEAILGGPLTRRVTGPASDGVEAVICDPESGASVSVTRGFATPPGDRRLLARRELERSVGWLAGPLKGRDVPEFLTRKRRLASRWPVGPEVVPPTAASPPAERAPRTYALDRETRWAAASADGEDLNPAGSRLQVFLRSVDQALWLLVECMDTPVVTRNGATQSPVSDRAADVVQYWFPYEPGTWAAEGAGERWECQLEES